MAFTEFFVRTDGSDVNGGSSDAAAAAITVASVTAVHDGGGAHTLTDDGVDGFAGAAVDDYICWNTASGGGGVPEYAIITGLTSDDIIVVQNKTSGGAFSGDLTSEAVNIGGAWLTVQNAFDLVDIATIDWRNAASDDAFLNIKAGTYDEAIDVDTNNGVAGSRIGMGGFTSSPRDGGRATIDNNSGGASTGTLKTSAAKGFYDFRDLILDNTLATPYITLWPTAPGGIFRRVKVTGRTTSLAAVWDTDSCTYFDCELILDAGSGTGFVVNCNNFNYFNGCLFRGGRNATNGNVLGNLANKFVYCVFRDSVAGPGILVDDVGQTFDHCLFQNNAASGIKHTAAIAGTPTAVVNCGFVNNGAFGIDVTGGAVHGAANGFFSNTSGTTNGDYVDELGLDQTGDPLFTNEGADDFSIAFASPWTGAGWPGTPLHANWTSYPDIGPVQRQETAGGGGAPGNMQGGLQ